MLPFVTDVSTAVSIQSLVLIAMERFGAVVFPIRSPIITSKRCAFFILTTCIVALAICFPYLFAFKLVEYPEKLACERRWSEAFGESSSDANFFLAVFVAFYYMPIILVTVLYSIILNKLKTQVFPTVNAEKQRAKRNRKVLKMAIAIVSGFVLCWVPFSIIALLVIFAWDSGSIPCAIEQYLVFPSFLAYANCVVNPCICFFFVRIIVVVLRDSSDVLAQCKSNNTF